MNILIFIFSIFLLLSIGYYAYAAMYAGPSSTFLWFWLFVAMCCGTVIVAIILHKKFNILVQIPKWIKMTVILFFIIGVAVFLSMEALIISKMNSKAKNTVEYVIVLGAQVRGERVTKSLAKRLDAAYEYLMENKDAKVICSGGQGSGEDISEALAMKRYLMDRGIDEGRIIMEDKSSSTYENLMCTMKIIGDKDVAVAVVTNNFHVYRAMYLAKYVGFTDVSGIAGKSDNRLLPNYMVREGLALFKELLVH